MATRRYRCVNVAHVTHYNDAARIMKRGDQMEWKPRPKRNGFGNGSVWEDASALVWFGPIPQDKEQVHQTNQALNSTGCYQAASHSYCDAYANDSRYGTVVFQLPLWVLLQHYSTAMNTPLQQIIVILLDVTVSHPAERPKVCMFIPSAFVGKGYAAVENLTAAKCGKGLRFYTDANSIWSYIPGAGQRTYRNWEVAFWMGTKHKSTQLVVPSQDVTIEHVPHNPRFCIPSNPRSCHSPDAVTIKQSRNKLALALFIPDDFAHIWNIFENPPLLQFQAMVIPLPRNFSESLVHTKYRLLLTKTIDCAEHFVDTFAFVGCCRFARACSE